MNVQADIAARTIEISRLIDAPRALVFEVFTNPKHIDAWWGPEGFRNETHSMKFEEGGIWHYTMHGPDGKDWPNWIGYKRIVPNELLITQRVENSSLADSLVAVHCAVQVAYGTDVRALQPRLAAAVAVVPRVLVDPAPNVQLGAFAADGIDLSIDFWIRDPENGQGNVRSDVNLAVLDVLNAAGVEIPFPQRVVHTVAPREAT